MSVKMEKLEEALLMDSHGDPLSFEQYHAKMSRQRASKLQKEEEAARAEAEEAGAGAASGRAPRKQRRPKADVGGFVELFEVQLAVAVLICLDLVATVAELLLTCRGGGLEGHMAAQDPSSPIAMAEGTAIAFAASGLRAFSAFTIVFFGVECALLIASFGMKFFGHIGYGVDVAVLATFLFFELTHRQVEVRLLGVLRLWRLVRLCNVVIGEHKQDAREAEALLALEQEKVQELQQAVAKAGDACRREVDIRRGVEDMLHAYRDEVDTLNEALRIAAADIFDVAEAEEDGATGESGIAHEGERKANGADRAAAVRAKGAPGRRIVVHEDLSWVQADA